MNTNDSIKAQLAGQWAGFDPNELVSDATGNLISNRGDWDPPAGIEPKRPLIHMAIGIPDAGTLPKDDFLKSTRKVITRPGEAAFIYGFGMGYAKLRAQLAERYSRNRGLQVDEEWFQLTNGSSGAIDLICRTLINPGDVIITESPTYMGTLRNFRGVLAQIKSVPMDEDGMLMDELEAVIVATQAAGKTIKFIYTISTFQNPTGATLSQERRIELLKLAAKHRVLILDDDAYGELYFGAKPPTSLSALSAGHGVITVGTLSKTLATGLRVGWIHGRPDLIRLMGKMRFAMGLNQMVVRLIADYMSDRTLDDHTDEVRDLYRRKMEVLTGALETHAGDLISFDRPLGGFYLWVKLHQGLTADAVWRTATHEGVSTTPGISFYPARFAPSGEHIRIAFPWTPMEDLEEGARRFGLACKRVSEGEGLKQR